MIVVVCCYKSEASTVEIARQVADELRCINKLALRDDVGIV